MHGQTNVKHNMHLVLIMTASCSIDKHMLYLSLHCPMQNY